MSILLTPEQEKFIQAKLQTGKYRNAEEVLEFAFRLLDGYEQAPTAYLTISVNAIVLKKTGKEQKGKSSNSW